MHWSYPKEGSILQTIRGKNVALEEQGLKLPSPTKTGTTIVGIVFKDGVVIGADTRATADQQVLDKNCFKIHYLAPNMNCCGAGTAADTKFTNDLVSSQLELHRLSTGRESRVVTALTLLKRILFKHQGNISAFLILGGYDVTGPKLYTIASQGNTDNVPFTTMGSGSLAAMSMLESRWKKDMERQEAIDLVKDALEAGVFNDLGSGGAVNIAIIEKGKTELKMEYSKPEREPKCRSYKFARGSTAVLNSSTVTVAEGDAMDTS
ncbi:9649_t:CDS:2 [Ambispora leptoticha]|uniref:Proteasome subunit beta n=1 Tax=Ambispora leptoticha TaxID=144679 RepID=A0A9N9CBA1_9GLOM|nr:9649_t:CDS:2 [Ambispora leptoticha]